jgi:hypothetical protein
MVELGPWHVKTAFGGHWLSLQAADGSIHSAMVGEMGDHSECALATLQTIVLWQCARSGVGSALGVIIGSPGGLSQQTRTTASELTVACWDAQL